VVLPIGFGDGRGRERVGQYWGDGVGHDRPWGMGWEWGQVTALRMTGCPSIE